MQAVGHNNYALTFYTPAIDFQGIWQPWNLIRLINKGVDLLHVNMLSDLGSWKLCEHERELLIIVEFYASMQGACHSLRVILIRSVCTLIIQQMLGTVMTNTAYYIDSGLLLWGCMSVCDY